MKTDILPSDLQALLRAPNPPRVIDVRSSTEYQSCHITGAENIPLDTIDSQLPGIEDNEPVVLVCQGGMRSSTACLRIQDRYSNVSNLSGGTNAWLAAGLPTECAAGVTPT